MTYWILQEGAARLKDAENSYANRRFFEEASAQNIDLKLVFSDQFELVVCNNERDTLYADGQKINLPDAVLPRFDNNDDFYYLSVLRHLESLGVPLVHGPGVINAVNDKMRTHQILAQNGIPTPRTMLVQLPVDTALVEQKIGFPIIVKTILGAHGSGVVMIDTAKQFQDHMMLLQETSPGVYILLQEYIQSSHGRDLRLLVVDGKVLGAMERRAVDDGFKANVSQGGQAMAYIPTKECRVLAEKTAAALGLKVTGVDLLFTENGFTVCEANQSPDFKGFEQATGVNVPRAIFAMMRKMTVRPGLGLRWPSFLGGRAA